MTKVIFGNQLVQDLMPLIMAPFAMESDLPIYVKMKRIKQALNIYFRDTYIDMWDFEDLHDLFPDGYKFKKDEIEYAIEWVHTNWYDMGQGAGTILFQEAIHEMLGAYVAHGSVERTDAEWIDLAMGWCWDNDIEPCKRAFLQYKKSE